jgi:hypothetical protein
VNTKRYLPAIPGNDLSSIWVKGEVTKLYIFSLFTALDSWKGKWTLPALLKNVIHKECYDVLRTKE